jgi:hypothetical protein
MEISKPFLVALKAYVIETTPDGTSAMNRRKIDKHKFSINVQMVHRHCGYVAEFVHFQSSRNYDHSFCRQTDVEDERYSPDPTRSEKSNPSVMAE